MAVDPAKFVREVRSEMARVTWPSRKETWITSVMVMIMVLITTMFFFVVDIIVGFGVNWIIKLGPS